MPTLPLHHEINIVIKVRLIAKGNDEAITGNEYSVRLYDKDIFGDDYLGQSPMDEEGEASFTITQHDFSKPMSVGDKPDFYFVVYKNRQPIFKSKVMSNLDLSDLKEFVMAEGDVIDLGTFLIDVD